MSVSPGAARPKVWVLFALLALFLTGIVVSFVLIATGWRPTTTKNYGELVQPPRPVRDVALYDADGRTVPFSRYKGKWTLLYFGPAECLTPCTGNLYKMRQVVAAQGDDAHRVQRVFVVTDPKARDMLRYTLADYPGMDVLFGAPESLRELAASFSLPVGTPLEGLHRLYVIDPLGNFMMSYPADADPTRINKDVKLLLRASHIG